MNKTTINKFFIFLLIIFSLFSITSCREKELTYLSDPIAIVYKNNTPYILNKKNELFSLDYYDAIVPYFDDILIVKKNNLFGYIKNSGEPLTEVKYQEAYPFSEGMAVVKLNNQSYIINESGATLYTFEDEVSSTSSFSESLLVITKETKQGYLKYDKETSTFDYLIQTQIDENTSILDSNLLYDYCGQFQGGYAVVGTLNSHNELKYTHINSNGEKLYDLEWDFANNFSEGFAVVGNMIDYTVKIYCSNQNDFDRRYTTTAEAMGYMYVDPSGKYLGVAKTDAETNEEYIDPYLFAAAQDYIDGIALVANLYFYSDVQKYNGAYDFSTKRYFYNYDFIDYSGKTIFGENGIYQNNWGGALCIYNGFFRIGEYYVTNYYSASWQVSTTNIEIADPTYPFSTVQYDLKNYKTDDELLENFPWIKEYLATLTYGKQSPTYVVDHVVYPYNMTTFEVSKYLDNKMVAKTQVYSGIDDTCGLVTINVLEDKLELSYIIPPLYDEIIY